MKLQKPIFSTEVQQQRFSCYDTIKITDLPALKRRAIISELNRQNPNIINQTGKTFYVHEIIKPNISLKGMVYWREFTNEFSKITF